METRRRTCIGPAQQFAQRERRPAQHNSSNILGFYPLAAVLLLAPALALAGWTGEGFVNHVYSHAGANYIQTTISDNPCGTAGKFWWLAGDSNGKDMLAIAMMALASDKTVGVFHNPTSPNCANGAQLVTMVYIAR